MPPRRRRSDPFREIFTQINTTRERQRGYLQHREIAEYYEREGDLDSRERREFWADYTFYMTSGKFRGGRYNDPERNPFWSKWGINPDDFDWADWREAMGYDER